MNCISNQVVLYRGRGYSNSFIPCRGVLLHTRFHHLSPFTRHVLGNLQAESPTRVSATAYLNTRVSSPGLSPIQVPSAGSPAEVSTTAPNDVCKVPEAPNGRLGTPGHVPTASQPTPKVSAAHGLQQLQTPETTCNSWTEDERGQ